MPAASDRLCRSLIGSSCSKASCSLATSALTRTDQLGLGMHVWQAMEVVPPHEKHSTGGVWKH